MRLKFTSKAMIAFGVGACLFVTTAFADMMLGSGYDKLKASAKHTTKQLASGLDSYTIEGSMSIKIDDQDVNYNYFSEKFGVKNQKSEGTYVNENFQKQYESYNYRDREQSIYKNFNDGNLYVTKYTEDYYEEYSYNPIGFSDPFQEDGSAEIEKIVDAVVGNLQDLVVVENADNGAYNYSGNLNASQVPALVNAVSSYVIKNNYNSERRYNKATYLPELSSDITVQSISGQVKENQDGLITNVNAELVLTGKDVDGASHNIVATVDFEIKDINSTVIETPDTSNAIVNTVDSNYENDLIKDYTTGTYTNNIVLEENGKLIKIGERTLNINSISKDSISGSFNEVVYEGYEDKYDAQQLTFTGLEAVGGIVVIHYTNDEGVENTAVSYRETLDSIHFDPEVNVQNYEDGGYSYGSTSLENFNSIFIKVFE